MAQQFSITEKGDIEMRYPPEPPQMNRLILFNFLLLELYQDELKAPSMLPMTSKPATCGVHRPYKAFYLKKCDTKDNATKFLFKSNNNDSFQDNIIHIVLLSPYPLFFFSIRVEKYLLVGPC